MKIWELHGIRTGGAIQSTPDGEADVQGLVLSEKAYFLAMQAFRPTELVTLVERDGAEGAARALVQHFASRECIEANSGRTLVEGRSWSARPKVVRSDEVDARQEATRRRG
jgi:hypothetical protein